MFKSRVFIIFKNNKFFVFVDGNLFYVQDLLNDNLFVSFSLNTYMYVLKNLSKFGLISNLKK